MTDLCKFASLAISLEPELDSNSALSASIVVPSFAANVGDESAISSASLLMSIFILRFGIVPFWPSIALAQIASGAFLSISALLGVSVRLLIDSLSLSGSDIKGNLAFTIVAIVIFNEDSNRRTISEPSTFS